MRPPSSFVLYHPSHILGISPSKKYHILYVSILRSSRCTPARHAINTLPLARPREDFSARSRSGALRPAPRHPPRVQVRPPLQGLHHRRAAPLAAHPHLTGRGPDPQAALACLLPRRNREANGAGRGPFLSIGASRPAPAVCTS